MKKICEHCEDEFEASRRDAKYCSTTCKNAAHRLAKTQAKAQPVEPVEAPQIHAIPQAPQPIQTSHAHSWEKYEIDKLTIALNKETSKREKLEDEHKELKTKYDDLKIELKTKDKEHALKELQKDIENQNSLAGIINTVGSNEGIMTTLLGALTNNIGGNSATNQLAGVPQQNQAADQYSQAFLGWFAPLDNGTKQIVWGLIETLSSLPNMAEVITQIDQNIKSQLDNETT
ncbi:hypothetical protein [Aureibacter tunicatorum]|uniref:Septal ring factor EnvC (AmiA/AmiB activator) n=1 Tax=Aureibacter tunicatorum TaxID=866807 RepID=A0AAE3XLA2_9BACT|nr:hypothetical protein [Aureibacter tunicatorum]MDR6239976.1 septal ring factor EnvC (AmiA/AmiB activator) [Aureibacter tunicatorum]BDD04448.1 hypothetical protein AUTU_19310 [Aureibacter tunicatorum]